ncbi:MAG: DNA adenine methylase [bacterium]|nr:DNA adenine methylase [bacterium]
MARKYNMIKQATLPFIDQFQEVRIPTTRYQGSKAKLVDWIWENIKDLSFASALDAFGGTGVVGYYLKQQGKQVFYNDYLKSNYYIGVALIENNIYRLSEIEIERLLTQDPKYDYHSFIAEIFKNIYYTDEENQWLDIVVQNIQRMGNIYKKALAYYALFQACLVKRPFNLFHRKNLYIRFADVKRTFGNKATWDRQFEEHFMDFIREISYLVYNNGKENKAYNLDVFEIEGNFDLVYIDPPYTSVKGVSVDYKNFYHFLEGLVNYEKWESMIDRKTINKRFYRDDNPWNDKLKIRGKFRDLFEKFRDSILVISYRSDGIPSIQKIESDLKLFKKRVRVHKFDNYKYVLSNSTTSEVLMIGE